MNKAELYYSEVCRRTEEQCSARQHFDTIAIAVLGFAGVLLGLAPLVVSQWTEIPIELISLVSCAFVIVVGSTMWGIRLRRWEFQPGLLDLKKNVDSTEYKAESLVLWSAHYMHEAFDKNKKTLRTKTICLIIAYACLAVEALGLTAIYFLGVYLHP